MKAAPSAAWVDGALGYTGVARACSMTSEIVG